MSISSGCESLSVTFVFPFASLCLVTAAIFLIVSSDISSATTTQATWTTLLDGSVFVLSNASIKFSVLPCSYFNLFVLIVAFPVTTSTSSIELTPWKSDIDKFFVAFSIVFNFTILFSVDVTFQLFV